MVRAEKIVDIDENTDVVALAEGVQSSGEAAVLHHDGKPVEKLVPVPAKKKARLPGKPMTFDDPFWKLARIARRTELRTSRRTFTSTSPTRFMSTSLAIGARISERPPCSPRR
jgi:hypothetical protein